MTLSPHDYEMIRHAIARGQVIVNDGERKRLAQLWSWRPRRNGKHTNKARVRFANGKFAHVPLAQIGTPQPERKHHEASQVG